MLLQTDAQDVVTAGHCYVKYKMAQNVNKQTGDKCKQTR